MQIPTTETAEKDLKILNPEWVNTCKRTFSFSNKSHWYTKHTEGQVSCPVVRGQHKMNSLVFSKTVLIMLVCYLYIMMTCHVLLDDFREFIMYMYKKSTVLHTSQIYSSIYQGFLYN